MINKTNIQSVNSLSVRQLGDKKQAQTHTSQKNPSFGGVESFVLGAIQACEKSPMVNVTVLDLSTAIVPRTIYEGQTNPYAGVEAFRRESSGLVVNCLIPSFIVLGIAHALKRPIMGKGSNLGSSWANQEMLEMVAKYWNKTDGSSEKRVKDTITNILNDIHGVDGKETKSFKSLNIDGKNFKESIDILTKQVLDSKENYSKKEVKKAYELIAKHTKITENIKFTDAEKFFGNNLESVIRDTPKVLKEFLSKNALTPEAVEKVTKKGTHLINAKSLLGLGLIIPLAASMQPINRWLTAKSSGKKGAPIYKDFGQTENRELSAKEKAALNKQKIISVGSMIGVALLSMMKLPKMSMFQFKGLFPTMDQARIISTATFASRMLASEDKNDLREATVRDIATFSSFYFLGDYVAKGFATLFQKTKGVQLINDLEPLKGGENIWKKIVHWTKNTAIKSSDEVVGKKATNLRSVCQLGNIAFSLIALGLLIPMMNRKKTNKEREAELKQMGIPQDTINKYYNQNFTMNMEHKNIYGKFFTSNIHKN